MWKTVASRLLAVVLLGCAPLLAQIGATPTPTRTGLVERPKDPALEFLEPYGLHNFSTHYIRALQSLLTAREKYARKEYASAQATLSSLWASYPVGHPSWGNLPFKPFGINLGLPACYYELRMLSDMTQFRLANPGLPPPPRTVRLTVLVVGASSGIEPRNLTELTQGGGVAVTHTIDPRVAQNGYRAVHESLRGFNEYVLAMTQGQLGVETHILPLPTVSLPVHAGVGSGGFYYASLVEASSVFAHVPPAELAATDWWWILYPSHVPEQYPDFLNTEFITGGMGVGADGSSPFFIIDDRWIVRKPPHLGSGEYSDIERSVYLPQWFQHEFFHHLFRIYGQFGLESTPHQWFNLANWPSDFVGRYEADYYHEALYKRLQTATPPLKVALRYATTGAPWAQLSVNDVLGAYRRSPVQNAWHTGDILFVGQQLRWRNSAPVSWNLQPDVLQGVLNTGPDCPYYSHPLGRKFNIVLERDAIGDLTSQIGGFMFLGEFYERL